MLQTRCSATQKSLQTGDRPYMTGLATASQRAQHLIEPVEELVRGAEQFHLDSGTQREDAHRFYLREGLEVSSLHFSRKL